MSGWWCASISHDKNQMLSDLGGGWCVVVWLALVGHQAWAPSDSAIDEVRGILVSAPPSPLHPQILSLGWVRDGIWAMVVFSDDE